MRLISRNILSLNERFAYNLIGKIRQYLLPFSNSFLKLQEKWIKNMLNEKTNQIKNNLIKLLPQVINADLKRVLNKEACKKIVLDANKILNHNFYILSKQIIFKNEIDWHLDFNSGNRWPKGTLHSNYNQVNVDSNADVKYPRELSRCHHFLNLGQAYILTNDEKYTKEFKDQINWWIKENPYKKSINWGCSMDIAIRASNWIYSLRMFLNSSLIDDGFLKKIFTSLYLHGRFIYENPEKNRVYNHNHYASDLAGQILISLLFDKIQIKETKSWKENGIYEFFREIRLQILPSGFSYERTTNYHRLVTELFAYTIIVLKNNQIEIPQDIFYRVKKMFEIVPYYSFEDGTAPIIGDQDSGRFLPFYAYDINYQKYLMNIGAVLFNDGIFKYHSGTNNIDVLFLFGIDGIEDFKELKSKYKKLESKAYSDAGFYIMRFKKVYLFINNSGLSHYNEVKGGTHTHSDLLSFVYSYNNIPFLIDPGTFVYSSNPTERMKFRSTAMHNTITVDDYDQNDLKKSELWSINRDAIPHEILWSKNDKMDIFEGSHTGYKRLSDSVIHFRRFELNKVNNELKIIDRIDAKKNHRIKCHFHFDENVDVKIIDKSVYCKKRSENIKINFKLNTNLDFSINLKKDYISKSYNHKVIAPYLIVTFKIKKSVEFITVINN